MIWIEMQQPLHHSNLKEDMYESTFSTPEPTTTSSENNNTSKSNYRIQPSRNDIIMNNCEHSFEEMEVDYNSGFTTVGKTNENRSICSSSNGLKIVYEAYLQIEAFLSDVLYRRRKIMYHESTTKNYVMNLPDFHYNIISFGTVNDRSITFVIAFANPKHVTTTASTARSGKSTNGNVDKSNSSSSSKNAPAAYALIATLDLFDQTYTEKEWVQHPFRSNSTFLREWSNKLAIQKRMLELQKGPYCVKDELLEKLKGQHLGVHTFDDNNNDLNNIYFDDIDDSDIGVWEPFVKQKLQNVKEIHAPKKISMSSLYEYCDVISNDAVVNRKPVAQIKSRNFPLEIKYS
mmetsp:Transcript_11094/g.12855  ORF Transcript_11094/g.12855 Transcript_11094/m.12855 type:complete len:346 (-) Transcript_11094:1231-2268(-)